MPYSTSDWNIIPHVVVWRGFKLFDTAWITDPIMEMVNSTGRWILDNIITPVRNWVVGIAEQITLWLREGWGMVRVWTEGISEPWRTVARLFLLPIAGVWNFFKAAFQWISDNVVTPIMNAVDPIVDWVRQALAGVVEALGSALQGFWSWLVENLGPYIQGIGTWLNEHVVKPIWSGLQWLWNWVTGSIMDVFNWIRDRVKNAFESIKRGDPTAAYILLAGFTGLGLAATGITSAAGIKVLGTGIEVGEIGSYIK
ncbi:MAG: hypothetical protein QMD46_14110, partial [Methanomicrobiales archaeon]|nr:hypothetical protein [Methanomicrobiales archaeon]